MRKMITSIAAVLAVSALMAGSAFAGADKLVVKGTDGTTTKFSVQDDGNITTTGGFYYDAVNLRVGVGTTTPNTSLHIAANSTDALRGNTNSQHNNGAQGAVINFVKSRGTQASPAVLTTGDGTGDYIGAFVAQYWNGTTYDRSSQFAFRNDLTGYTVSGANVVPTMILFQTGASTSASDPNIMTERFRISSKGNIVAGNKGGVASANMTVTDTDGFLYIPVIAGQPTSTPTAYTGHSPIAVDAGGAKLWIYVGGAWKSATLN